MKILKTYKLFETIEQDGDMITSAKLPNDSNVIRKLKQGADVNAIDHNGQTALIITCYRSKNIDTIKYLLENGADPNIQDKNGNTALHLASINHAYSSVFDLLLIHNANMRLKNNKGENFIDINIRLFHDNKKIIETCVKHDESIIVEFIKKGIIIDDEIKKKYPHFFTAVDLNLL